MVLLTRLLSSSPGGWSVVRDVLKDTDWDADPFLATVRLREIATVSGSELTAVLQMFRAHPKMQRIFTLSFGPRDAEGVVHDGVVTFGTFRSSQVRRATPQAHLSSTLR